MFEFVDLCHGPVRFRCPKCLPLNLQNLSQYNIQCKTFEVKTFTFIYSMGWECTAIATLMQRDQLTRRQSGEKRHGICHLPVS